MTAKSFIISVIFLLNYYFLAFPEPEKIYGHRLQPPLLSGTRNLWKNSASSMQEWHWSKFSAGAVSLQKVPAKGVVLSQDVFLWVLEVLRISDWPNIQHSGSFLAARSGSFYHQVSA